MNRIEQIRKFLQDTGLATNRQIAAAFGWKLTTTTAVVSHAVSYGYVEPVASVYLGAKNGGSPVVYWGARDQIIRKPGQ